MQKIIICILAVLILLSQNGLAQKYYPKGDPDKLQVELSVPLWLPWINGQAGVDGLLNDIQGQVNSTPADLLKNLKVAAMLNADISKGHWIGFVNYTHITLETETSNAQLPLGGNAAWYTTIKTDILDLAAGGRFHFNKGMIDPFVGVRYYNLSNAASITANNFNKTGSKKVDYWDPFLGLRVFYYPQPRWMLFLRSDIGGIWGGSSKFSWNIESKAGYAISPTVDIAAGFRSWSFEYAEYTGNKSIFYIDPHFYGFELSASFMIPKRSKQAFPKKTISN